MRLGDVSMSLWVGVTPRLLAGPVHGTCQSLPVAAESTQSDSTAKDHAQHVTSILQFLAINKIQTLLVLWGAADGCLTVGRNVPCIAFDLLRTCML